MGGFPNPTNRHHSLHSTPSYSSTLYPTPTSHIFEYYEFCEHPNISHFLLQPRSSCFHRSACITLRTARRTAKRNAAMYSGRENIILFDYYMGAKPPVHCSLQSSTCVTRVVSAWRYATTKTTSKSTNLIRKMSPPHH